MSLFQNETASVNESNYKRMRKRHLIMLLQSQKSDMEALQRKFGETGSLSEENKRLIQQAETLGAENKALKETVADLEKKLSAQKSTDAKTESTDETYSRILSMAEDAQNAAFDYLEKIKAIHSNMSLEYSKYEASAMRKADNIIKNAVEKAESIRQNAHSEANIIWDTLQTHFDSYFAEKKSFPQQDGKREKIINKASNWWNQE